MNDPRDAVIAVLNAQIEQLASENTMLREVTGGNLWSSLMCSADNSTITILRSKVHPMCGVWISTELCKNGPCQAASTAYHELLGLLDPKVVSNACLVTIHIANQYEYVCDMQINLSESTAMWFLCKRGYARRQYAVTPHIYSVFLCAVRHAIENADLEYS